MSGTGSLLIVDDGEIDRRLLGRGLGARGYEVTWADGGHQALALMRRRAFDLVMMPDVTGSELLEQVRCARPASRLPVIVVATERDDDRTLEALSRGADDYVHKPIDAALLATRIESHLSRARAEGALHRLNEELERRVEARTAEIRQTNEALEARERCYQALYDDTPVMFLSLSPDSTIVSINRFGAQALGYRAEDLIGCPSSVLCPEPGLREHLEAWRQMSAGPAHRELRLLRSDGGELVVRASMRNGQSGGGEPNMVLICEDVTRANALSAQLSYQASYDLLTGLVNRREFDRRLQRVVETAREGKTRNVLCYLDLDQFRVINDTCGHVAGDELLRQLGDLLRKQIRSRDTLARLGGDEFAVLLEHCSMDRAYRVAHALCETVESFRFRWEQKTFALSVSIGVASIDEDSSDFTDVLSAADTACFAAKDEGRNRIHVYHKDDADLARRQREMQWVARINWALEEDRLRLDFQPIVPVRDDGNAGAHYELLLRMQSETGERILPGAFLPAAERYNLSSRLDRWVISSALDWLDRHPAHLRHLELCAINLSGHSLGDQGLMRYIVERFEQTGIPPEKLCFEITETAAVGNMAHATRFMARLKDLGCRLALDDFGSGLSSFAYLKHMPIDFLKIDGMFVKDIVDDPVHLAMVKSINDIGRVMGIRTIAEFVENAAILHKLAEIGVDYAQGYGIAAPRGIEHLS